MLLVVADLSWVSKIHWLSWKQHFKGWMLFWTPFFFGSGSDPQASTNLITTLLALGLSPRFCGEPSLAQETEG